jgi:hypothetical protein
MLRRVNAVAHLAALMSPDVIRRLAVLRVGRFEAVAPMLASPGRVLDVEQARARVVARWGADLCGLLNAMTRSELAASAEQLRLPTTGKSPALRERLWARGAELERGGAEVSPALQPRPVLLGGHLVVMAPPRGMAPPSAAWPRPVPAAMPASPPAEEPDSVDDLLAAADRAIGVRLGPRGRDKGAWGTRAAQLLGIIERGVDEPDWRGDIEVKTVPVAREASGLWLVVEDPAIAMVGTIEASGGLAKLQRTLWLARASLPSEDGGEPDATIVSWYLLDWDAEVGRLAKRYLHVRPKGPRASTTFGMYLHKRFFADAGLLATLNGW